MFISKDLLVKKSVTPSRWAVLGLVALPLWVQAQTVISAPKSTMRIQPVQVESVSKGSDAIRVLSEIEGLREELAALRNEIEVQQHELEKLGKRQQEVFDDFDKRLIQQEELVSTTQKQLAEFKTETTEKIASISAIEANQKIQVQTTQGDGSIEAPGGVGELLLTKPTPVQSGMRPPVNKLPRSGGPTASPGTFPPTVAAVPTTHPPSGISVTNSNGASPILAPRSNQPVSPAVRPVAVGGGLGSASPGRATSVPGGPIGGVATGSQVASRGQVITPIRGTRLPTNVAINTRPSATGQINAPIGDPAEEQAVYENAFELLKQSRYSEAIRGFNNLLRSYPGSTLADDAQYWIAEAHYVTRGFESALLGFRTVVARYPSSPRVAEAMLRIGYIQYEVGAYNQARQTLTALVTRYPSSRVAVSAETRLKKMIQEGR